MKVLHSSCFVSKQSELESGNPSNWVPLSPVYCTSGFFLSDHKGWSGVKVSTRYRM